MHYQGTVYRPPSEADSILLQITTGCSHNGCTFCGMYRTVPFTIKDEAVIMADIDFAASHCRRQRRLFLGDGDALIVPRDRLLNILQAIRGKLPWLERIGAYANPRSILLKTERELLELRRLGLGIIYLGVESGDEQTLREINKGADAETIVKAGQAVRSAGIKLSVTVLLGIAGSERSLIHARETGNVLSAIDPDYVGALSLMLVPGTEAYEEHRQGGRTMPAPREILAELKAMIGATQLTDGYFHANHASNYLPIKARLPRDRDRTLQLIEDALAGRIELKPESLRAL